MLQLMALGVERKGGKVSKFEELPDQELKKRNAKMSLVFFGIYKGLFFSLFCSYKSLIGNDAAHAYLFTFMPLVCTRKYVIPHKSQN